MTVNCNHEEKRVLKNTNCFISSVELTETPDKGQAKSFQNYTFSTLNMLY